MSWNDMEKFYVDETADIFEGSVTTKNIDGSTTITFKNGSTIIMGSTDGIAGSPGKIFLICDSIAAANYLPEIEEQKAIDMRIFKVKCRSCKGNYQLKDPNSIFFTKCKLCDSGKLQFNK